MYFNVLFWKVTVRLSVLAIVMALDACYSPGVLMSKYDLPEPGSENYHYVIHTENSNYRIRDIDITDGILSGKSDTRSSFHKKINIFLSSDTIIKINPDHIISLPVTGIKKVERQEVSIADTFFLTGLIASVPLAGWLIHALISWNFNGLSF